MPCLNICYSLYPHSLFENKSNNIGVSMLLPWVQWDSANEWDKYCMFGQKDEEEISVA
jgi:hypothetical protein